MELIGYVCALLVGISLGILGSGGSILTLPIMVYLLDVNPVDATGLSLFVVGITSTVGGISYINKKLVDIKTATIFAIPSILSVFLTRKFLVPAIPDPVFSMSMMIVSKEMLILLLFAVLMVIVGYSMIRDAGYREPELHELHQFNYPWLVTVGLASGILTGFLGVGGGFIIIPALVLFAKVPVRMSVGTSLLIIAFNSLTGFAEEMIEKHDAINYPFLFLFALLAVAGIFIGFRISLSLRPLQIKKVFGWFILLTGISVFIKEIGVWGN